MQIKRKSTYPKAFALQTDSGINSNTPLRNSNKSELVELRHDAVRIISFYSVNFFTWFRRFVRMRYLVMFTPHYTTLHRSSFVIYLGLCLACSGSYTLKATPACHHVPQLESSIATSSIVKSPAWISTPKYNNLVKIRLFQSIKKRLK